MQAQLPTLWSHTTHSHLPGNVPALWYRGNPPEPLLGPGHLCAAFLPTTRERDPLSWRPSIACTHSCTVHSSVIIVPCACLPSLTINTFGGFTHFRWSFLGVGRVHLPRTLPKEMATALYCYSYLWYEPESLGANL